MFCFCLLVYFSMLIPNMKSDFSVAPGLNYNNKVLDIGRKIRSGREWIWICSFRIIITAYLIQYFYNSKLAATEKKDFRFGSSIEKYTFNNKKKRFLDVNKLEYRLIFSLSIIIWMRPLYISERHGEIDVNHKILCYQTPLKVNLQWSACHYMSSCSDLLAITRVAAVICLPLHE